MKKLSIILVALAISMSAAPAGAAENNYIAVTGSGEAEQWPDYAVITAGVQSVERTTKDAITKTTQMLREMAADLKKMGIAEERIEFLQPFVERKDERVRQADGEYKEVITGYEAAQQIRVTVDKPGRAGEIVTVLTDRGGQIRAGVSYLIKNPINLQARARALAISDARKKAEDYAKGAGSKLGQLLIVEESRIGEFRLHPALRNEVTGEGPEHHRIGHSAMAPRVPLTPQPVSSTVTLYVKFALQ